MSALSCLSADVPALVLARVPQKQPQSEAEVKPWPGARAARSPPSPGLSVTQPQGTGREVPHSCPAGALALSEAALFQPPAPRPRFPSSPAPQTSERPRICHS